MSDQVSSKRSLYMKHEEAKEKLTAKMKAKAEEEEVSSKRSLYMKHEVATDLHETAKARLTAKMKAKAEEEESKLQSRRAKQEQQLVIRANKKATYQAAKDAETIVELVCEDLEAAIKLRAESKNDSSAGVVMLAAQEVGHLKKKLEDIKEKLEAAKEKLVAASTKQDIVKQATDVTIVEQKSQRLREAWNNSQKAWDLIQRAIRKRPTPEGKDRALTKRVKGLIG